ncbi:hypothetical protein [Bdellovibrio sp. HCB337]|uniref:hypothetical protein n=1 Tax=Bdellovibrio sp. HCB337 TaxID=3394358 RepID=UPI0039A6D36C
MRLTNEQLDVWRPVIARRKGADPSLYQILPQPQNLVPGDETWEFPPGAFVLVKGHISDGRTIKIAYELSQN